MLDCLRIKNLALIDDLEMNFAPGLNVLTGETGAGKTFIIKALNFVVGEKMDVKMVRPGHDRAVVEAQFLSQKNTLVLRRELLAEKGRSRLYVNDKLSSQETVKQLSPALITHTSQHGQHQLLHPAFQAKLVDEWMNQPDLLKSRDQLLDKLHEITKKREALLERSKQLSEKRDLLEMQRKMIKKVAPEAGEEERLEELRTKWRTAEEKRRHYQQIMEILHGNENEGLLALLGHLENALESLAPENEEMASVLEATSNYSQTAQDLSDTLRSLSREMPDIDSDQIEDRLYVLAQLKRKLHRTLPEILSLQEEIEENLSFLDVCTLDIHQMDKAIQQTTKELASLFSKLNSERRKAGASFTAALEKELQGLGFSEKLRVLADYIPTKIVPNQDLSEDRVALLWAPNPGQPPQSLDRIASGGELSRFLLGVISMRSQSGDATLIFDEIDAGIGGLTLNKIAERLDALSQQRQLIVITHWPRLAKHAARHFQIVKEFHDQETFTKCKPLEGEDREAELARMAGIENFESF